MAEGAFGMNIPFPGMAARLPGAADGTGAAAPGWRSVRRAGHRPAEAAGGVGKSG